MGLRNDLADHIRAEVPGLAAVFPYPAEVTAVPAVVIHPSPGEYWVPWTLGGPATMAWAVVVELIVQRTNPQGALDDLEDLAVSVIDACMSFAQVDGGRPRFQAFGDLGPVTVGSIESVSGQISLLIPRDRGQT